MAHISSENGTRQETLRGALTSVLHGRRERAAARFLVDASMRMALAYLRAKTRMGTLDPKRFGLSLEDMAIDSIAELYERDETGKYVEICTYFESIPWSKMDDAGLEIALRRIVFGKVTERMFRQYRENDPNLGKVIRNIKDAAAAAPDTHLERVDGKLWIVVGRDVALATDRPTAPPDLLESYVTAALGKDGRTSEALDALARFFEFHPHYRNGYSVSALATMVRSAFIRLGAALEDATAGETFTEGEIADALSAAIDMLRTTLPSTYVSTQKLHTSTFDVYLHTVRDILASTYLHGTASHCSHFDVMASHSPALTRSEYRREHRNKVEYMVKLARARLAELLLDDAVI